jgi:ABC-type bacteriocin/lantibiotic exporter with double-glycine peptidase domain
MLHLTNVPLIPQTQTWACWYACAQMLVQWKRRHERSTLADQMDPSEVSETIRWHVANNGLTYGQVVTLAELLGLRHVPPMSISLHVLENLLRWHGPLWVHGQSHIVVFTGADRARDRVFVHNP